MRFRFNFQLLLWLHFLGHFLTAKDAPYLRYKSILEIYQRESTSGSFSVVTSHARLGGLRRPLLLMFRWILK